MKAQIWKLGVGRWQTVLFLFVLLASAFCRRVQGQSYSIDWYKIAGGGGTSTGAQYVVTGTIGQHNVSGMMSGGPVTGTNYYSVTGGYWSIIYVS